MEELLSWTRSDPLGAALHHLHMSGAFYCRSDLRAPWGVTLPSLPDCLMFHVVLDGECWLDEDGATPQRLQTGDFALVPHGQGHRLLCAPGAAAPSLFDLPCETISERYELRYHDGGGAPTLLVCGAVRFDEPAARRLVAHLPRRVVVQTSAMGGAERLRGLLLWMGEEARTLGPGGEALVTRLADVLVIQALRHWMQHDPAARTGWLGALQDARIGRALAALHREPARAWTLADLAAQAAMSRSAFAARFAQQLGVPPMQYLAQWRMQIAQLRLREGGGGLAALAAEVGYQSEAAFNRAFKRHTGVTPGATARAGAANAGVAG